jgi:hypothetical protein
MAQLGCGGKQGICQTGPRQGSSNHFLLLKGYLFGESSTGAHHRRSSLIGTAERDQMLATRGQALHMNIGVRVLVCGLPHIGIKISGIWIGLVVVHSGDVGIQISNHDD